MNTPFNKLGLLNLDRYNAFGKGDTGLLETDRYNAYHNLTSQEKVRYDELEQIIDTPGVTDAEVAEWNALVAKKSRKERLWGGALDWLGDLLGGRPGYGDTGYVPPDEDDDERKGISPILLGGIVLVALVGGGILIYQATKKK